MKNIFTILLIGAATFCTAQNDSYVYNINSTEISIISDHPSVELFQSTDGKLNVTVIATVNDVPVPGLVTLDWDESKGRLKANTNHRAWKKKQEEVRKMKKHDSEGYYMSDRHINFRTKLQVYLPNKITQLYMNTEHGRIKGHTLSQNIGSVDIRSEHGSIDLIFSNLSQNGKIKVHSEHGFVDVSVPEDCKADVSIHTGFGEIYSDLELVYEKKRKGMNELRTTNVKATYNGGGTKLSMASEHADLFLRKN